MEKKYVYQIEKPDGKIEANFNTGTRVWTKKHNAVKALKKMWRWEYEGLKVVEYELVKTGNIFT